MDLKFAFHLSGLAGLTIQFLNGTHELSELVLARIGPARGSEPLSSPALVGQSAGIWRVVAGKNVRARQNG